jgi:hypothetical protein
MSGKMRKPTPRGASSDPETLEAQLVAAVGGAPPSELHALVDGAVQHLVSAVVRGDRDGVDALAGAVRRAADEVPAVDISEHHAALHRLAVLPRVADAIARLAPSASVELLSRAPAGSPLREVLAVLVREARGEKRFLRAGEIHEAGEFSVSERRLGQVLQGLLEAGWVVQVVRHTPGPIRHYALSPVGAQRAFANQAENGNLGADAPAPRERFRRFPPADNSQIGNTPKRGSPSRARGAGKGFAMTTGFPFGPPT